MTMYRIARGQNKFNDVYTPLVEKSTSPSPLFIYMLKIYSGLDPSWTWPDLLLRKELGLREFIIVTCTAMNIVNSQVPA